MTEFPLCSLDLLPPRCGLDTEVQTNASGQITHLRFRAYRLRRLRRNRYSGWSAWLPYVGEPIALSWETFWDA